MRGSCSPESLLEEKNSVRSRLRPPGSGLPEIYLCICPSSWLVPPPLAIRHKARRVERPAFWVQTVRTPGAGPRPRQGLTKIRLPDPLKRLLQAEKLPAKNFAEPHS